MIRKKYTAHVVVTASVFALASMGELAIAQTSTRQDTTATTPPANARTMGKETKDAAQQVGEATNVVKQMKREAGMRQLLQQAQGVFVVPKYGRAALGVGARGGEGVLLVKQNGNWSDPAFYNVGGVSVGLQAGAEGGAIAMVLNNQKAVDSFKQDNNWSLNADAGLTIVNWSPKAQGSVGKGDVVVWANTKGLLGDLAVSVTDINFDKDETAAFYGKQVALQDIFSGNAKSPAHQVAALKQALPAGASATSSGSSDSRSTSSGNARSNQPPAEK